MSAVPTAISIGNFDGVHIGHAALLHRARVTVGPTGRVVVLSFDPHPSSVLRPHAAPARLTTWARRETLLRAAGADEIVRLEPTQDQLGLSPEEFIAGVVQRFRPSTIVEGSDFRFGKGRAGDVQLLARLGATHGFQTIVVDPVDIDLSDQLVTRASSSVVRWLLSHGRVQDAARVLGRPYELSGSVVRGDRRGRTIGFPTANLRAEAMLPAAGVYAGWADLPDNRRMLAAINVGARPTFGSHDPRLEAHLFEPTTNMLLRPLPWAPLEGLPEYDWPLRIIFTAFLRDQYRFGSVDALVDQLARDCERIGELDRASRIVRAGHEVPA